MEQIQIQPLIELAIFIIALLGTIIPMHIHLDNKMDKRSKEATDLINAIREDIKDFHTRLIILEERNRNK